MMSTRIVAFLLLISLAASSIASAQTRGDRPSGVVVTWTAVGAGAGFGIGLWAGLTAFDDAINSDRKVWTSAIIGAAAGAVGGYFLGRALRSERSSANPRLSSQHLTERDPQFAIFSNGRRAWNDRGTLPRFVLER